MSDESIRKYFALKLLPERDMAMVLGIKYSMIRKMRISGHLPFVQIGKKILYRPSAVEAWLGKQEESHAEMLNEVRRIS
ncbi:helix-turn-helix domain-containing protein [Pectinatus frisingensis]|uniref:helix-turn-helix domain-containing protein n=1 Tax=Pectinatus frisingensis TaxID=865 RepID=UPI0018C5CFAE|nr:helix-turn-helix domain-containing protein [Pectinatus frisingensis]